MDKFEGQDQPVPGNLSILTKVDKLREFIGTRIPLPQLVVVGDQSSGKSSVLENLTGFAFPRDAELCTRYATQITCRREAVESITVTIMASPDAAPDEHTRRKASLRYSGTIANKKMSPSGFPLPAFSEHMLKIEKQGPNEEHFTVIDVPGIFRRETEGVTTEGDIQLVRNMVKKYMQDSRTIILAIIPSNVDPATQEILKLAKKFDTNMTRTMAVLTKPDLAIEQITQKIAIDHVLGQRGDLTLGYYIVKNRGPDPDDANKTLEQGQADERAFFNSAPWSVLVHTGKAGIACLKQRVRELLTDLIKKEFPKLKSEVNRELSRVRDLHAAMGAARNDQHTQRVYLSRMSEAFQSVARDALNAYYVGDKIFSNHELRLITRIVDASESYTHEMITNGHTRWFEDIDIEEKVIAADEQEVADDSGWPDFDFYPFLANYPELEAVINFFDVASDDDTTDDIMDYIDEVYKSSRGQDLGNHGTGLIATLFKEQSKKWEDITLTHMSVIICHVHRFISTVIKSICPDKKVFDELWNGYLLEELMASYKQALDNARFLLKVEREGTPLTLNNFLGKHRQQLQANRLAREAGKLNPTGRRHRHVVNHSNSWQLAEEDENDACIKLSQLKDLTINKTNGAQVREYMHDLLSSYYTIARDRFVDLVYLHPINYYLLFGEKSPLKIFSTDMVMSLNEEQLDMIAAEGASDQQRREKLVREISNFEAALKVLKGSR
ncbi:interferon-induced GTP-binding protein Mx2 [Xylaria intraflava]|nr:interferon-induced GTP-binding protein Mx2 [Xylaria intraflava]